MSKFFSTIFLFFLICNPIKSQTPLTGLGKILPEDASSRDESFTAFTKELKIAVENKDAEFIDAIISPTIQMNQDEPEKNTSDNFKKTYNLSDANNEFWVTSKKLLNLGAYYAPNSDSASFMYPSLFYFDVYNNLLGEDYYFEFAKTDNMGSAVGENVLVYEEANENSKSVGTLSYDIVKIKNFDYDSYVPWFKIETKEGKTGYVRNGDIYLAIFDYYMVLKKIDGMWKMVAFERVSV